VKYLKRHLRKYACISAYTAHYEKKASLSFITIFYKKVSKLFVVAILYCMFAKICWIVPIGICSHYKKKKA
jgi:hypothetical protein